MWIALLCAAVVIAFLVYRYHKLMYHFRPVKAGKLYRSGTLGPVGLWVVHRVLGVNTIINLRLESEYPKRGWYARQAAFCEHHQIRLVNIPMAQDTPPTESQIQQFVDELDREGSVCLIHCEMGVIRTGMMVVAVATRRFGVRDQQVWEHFPLYGHKLDARRQRVREFILHCAAGVSGKVSA
ncbi:MAG: tyrosine-protein phosphatase [Pseudomonadota bacterium]|nr:tyrosine-protein phosphatase [Pseudomonadota bacterium]MEE3319452.1 tyrosine-protein phosphatase [Pseudomonadota bacterium]